MDWSGFLLSLMRAMRGEVPQLGCTALMHHRADWNDILAMKGAREVLKGVEYPDDATRRSLYASWLRVFASNKWHDSFDGLMLDCVAATPSPTTPGQPLLANIYKVTDHVIDRPYPNVRTPVLDMDAMPTVFGHERDATEPLPTSPGIVNYLADLIRRSHTSREALNEAGLIIGFLSLALAVVTAKPVGDVLAFFRTRMKNALAAAVPTSYDGDVFCPSGSFLVELARKAHSTCGVVKPFLVLLVLGQYAYHVNAEEAGPSADIKFLEEGFLKEAKFGLLEVVDLLYGLQERTGISAAVINQAIRNDASQELLAESCIHVGEFLADDGNLKQKTRPWCRASNYCFFLTLNLRDNLDYAMRLTALLAPDPNDQLWQRPEFSDVPAQRKREARFWARDFKRALQSGKRSKAAKTKTPRDE